MDRERHAIISVGFQWPDKPGIAVKEITEYIDEIRASLGADPDRPFIVNTAGMNGNAVILLCSWWEWKQDAATETDGLQPARSKRKRGSPDRRDDPATAQNDSLSLPLDPGQLDSGDDTP